MSKMIRLKSNSNTAKPAIFLDRDGTLIHDRGYLRSPDEVHFYDNTILALKKIQNHFLLFIVTNQSGISRGIQTEQEVMQVNQFVVEQLEEQGINIQALYSCPHQRQDGCNCIKPNPTFALEAANKFNIDLEQSFSIGDHPHDVEFGRQFGGTGLYLLTGHGNKHRHELTGNEPVFDDIALATDWILNNSSTGTNQQAHSRHPSTSIRHSLFIKTGS